jgi:hypothetical protein
MSPAFTDEPLGAGANGDGGTVVRGAGSGRLGAVGLPAGRGESTGRGMTGVFDERSALISACIWARRAAESGPVAGRSCANAVCQDVPSKEAETRNLHT